ncbi:hypothetical protein LR48_Vigan10g176100 [Vigna angularis]|uniref:Uncharacterized protein n=1 Tax=Phaseolus angularis TaxID=3914 RepID=A0A0L9VM96_PHAAN|nr:hypothetical protein LR48_Vigan10g176100 [Vigna angularis]
MELVTPGACFAIRGEFIRSRFNPYLLERSSIYPSGCGLGTEPAGRPLPGASLVCRSILPGTQSGTLGVLCMAPGTSWHTIRPSGRPLDDARHSLVHKPALWASFVRRPALTGSVSSGGVREGSARGDSGDSPSSVSSYFLEEAVGSSGGDPESPVLTNDRIFHGVALFLLKGGIRVVGSPFEPDGQGTVVSELAPVVPSRDPRRIRATSIGDLTAPDLEAVRTINTLPRRISARHLVECLSLEDCGPKAFELMTTPGPRKSNFLTIRKKSGASSSTARPTNVPKVSRPPPAGASTGRVPPTDKAGGSGVKVSGSSLPPEVAAVQVGPTSGAAMTSADPTRKRKDPTAEGRKDKEGSSSRSASKKARKDKGKEKDRERVLAVPLPGGVFSPDFSMSDRAKFHMSSSQRALIEPLSELELTNAMLEMSTRTSALAWYLRNFADRPGVAEVRAELDREKKNAASLQVTLEQMVLNQDEYDKKIEQLEADLEKAKREAAEGLSAALAEQERMAEESRQLKAEVTRLKEAEAERIKTNEELTLEVAKAREQIVELESTILFEHEEGFNKALRQVTLLAGVQDPFSLGVDIEKDVFNGVLVDLNAAEENEPTAEAAGGGKN